MHSFGQSTKFTEISTVADPVLGARNTAENKTEHHCPCQ